MKKVTDDLKITGIELSIARLGATVTFEYLDGYIAKAWYLRGSEGNKWIETGHSSAVKREIIAEIEENEDNILPWVEEQFAKETDRMDPEVETYDILQLQKMDIKELEDIYLDLGLAAGVLPKQQLIYAILEKQAQ